MLSARTIKRVFSFCASLDEVDESARELVAQVRECLRLINHEAAAASARVRGAAEGGAE